MPNVFIYIVYKLTCIYKCSLIAKLPLLQGFVVNVLRHQPSDLIEFAAQYFSELLDNRVDQRGGNVMDRDVGEEAMVTGSDNDDFMDEAEGRYIFFYFFRISYKRFCFMFQKWHLWQDEQMQADANLVCLYMHSKNFAIP